MLRASSPSHTALAARRPDVAAEILRGHDIHGQGGPALGRLYIVLLEDHLTGITLNPGIANLPLD